MNTRKRKYAFAIHGGAGTISRKTMNLWKEKAYREVLHKAVLVGSTVLDKGGRAIDAVVEAVKELEDSALFNAGKGAVFSYKGENELDASLMDGKTLQGGAVAAVTLIKNPILLAREVMLNSKHVLLSGEDAKEFAMDKGIVFKPAEYFFDEYRFKQWQRAKEKNMISLDHEEGEKEEKYGTVGAVALDRRGNLAAATSTGGMVNKRYGRIGDSPLLGAGTYANNESCAVSCTGQGEYFIRLSVAHEISSLLRYKDLSLEDAAKHVIHDQLKKIGGKGGLIAIDKEGNIAMKFNTKGMYRASKKEGEKTYIGIYKTDLKTE
jgi:beta-aspartyl-peptidase (threonine type)